MACTDGLFGLDDAVSGLYKKSTLKSKWHSGSRHKTEQAS